jgi:hypothetical protein
MESLTIKLVGIAPLIHHNIQGVDPRYARASGIKEITSKRTKTEADELELMRLEFISGLYWNNGPILPGLNVDAALAQAASKLMKNGKKIIQSSIQTNDTKLVYGKQHKTPDALFADSKHVLYCPATIPSTKARIMRARPIFPEWSAEVVILYHTVSKDQLVQCATYVGDFIGLCDWRPRYGRFKAMIP